MQDLASEFSKIFAGVIHPRTLTPTPSPAFGFYLAPPQLFSRGCDPDPIYDAIANNKFDKQ